MTDFAKIGAAVIGTGFIGTVHVQTLRRLGVQVRGVLGSSPERGADRAAEIGVRHAYASLDDLLADDSVDVVHVTSPNHAHYDQVKAILAAGKNVVCEKPLAMTSAQSAEMVEIAKGSGKVAAVCYNIRFYPLNQQAHGMVQAGELATSASSPATTTRTGWPSPPTGTGGCNPRWAARCAPSATSARIGWT
jgi:predicted dehydrogenase